MDWSENKIAREAGPEEAEGGGEAAQIEEEKLSEEQKAEEERSRASRRIGATALCTDGKYIYALSIQVKREEDDGPLSYEKHTVEVFEIEDVTNLVKFVKSFVLKKDADTDLKIKGGRLTSDLGFFNHM